MDKYSTLAMAFAMTAAFILLAGGIRLSLDRQSRTRGILMMVAAAVVVMNVMIWTV